MKVDPAGGGESFRWAFLAGGISDEGDKRMTRVALVLGFGFGQANKYIANFVAKRNSAESFQYIVAQEAVLAWLYQSVNGVPISHMHDHCAIYVNTLDAIGLGLMNLHKIIRGNAPYKIEVLAHYLQFERANDTGELAITLLKQTPPGQPDLNLFLQFLKEVEHTQPEPPKPMRLNRLRESWRQPWTCYSFLYRAFETIAKRRDFDDREKRYNQNPGAFYEHLKNLQSQLAQALLNAKGSSAQLW